MSGGGRRKEGPPRPGPARPPHRTSPPGRITLAGLTFDPMCPAGVSGVRVSGLCYLGSRLDFSFSEGTVTLEVRTPAGPGAPPLEAELWPSQTRFPLRPGRQLLPPTPLPGPQASALPHPQPRWPGVCPHPQRGLCPCRAQGLLCPLCGPDTKVPPGGAEAVSSAPRTPWEKLLKTLAPTARPLHTWGPPSPGPPRLVLSWL